MTAPALVAAFATGCGGPAPSDSMVANTHCDPNVFPIATLAYPQQGATGVSTTLADVILIAPGLNGVPNPNLFTVTVTAASGAFAAANAAPTTAPLPLPSPIVTLPTVPAGDVSGEAYAAVPLAAIAPQTTYTVSETYLTAAQTGPCIEPNPVVLGSFTTGS